MADKGLTRQSAQERADRIRVFRDELAQAEREGAIVLSPEQRESLRSYHDGILEHLDQRFDVDLSETQKQMSWGMRIAATAGAMALAAAVYFLFYRFWGSMTTAVQVVTLVAAPILAVGAMHWFSRRERTLYFTGLLGMVAFACFVLNLVVLGTIFNITPTENAFLLWGAFGVLLAYGYGLRLLLFFGLLALLSYLTAKVGAWSGCYWLYLGQRPENYMGAGLILFGFPLALRHRVLDRFPSLYRLVGLLSILIAVLVLSNWGQISYLPLDAEGVELVYQLVGFLISALAVWVGIRLAWKETVNVGSTFFVLFLYTKFFDWWWDLMPKYLFFLIVGLVAVGLLVILRKARDLVGETRS